MTGKTNAPWFAFIATVLCYSPVLFFEYGHFDDYRMLAVGDQGGSLAWLSLSEGRPIFALWAHEVVPFLDGIEDLVFLRVISLLGIGFTAVLLSMAWLDAGFSPRIAAGSTIALVTLPPFQVIAAWSTAAPCAWALCASVGASGLAVEAARAERFGIAIGPTIGATLLLTLALLTYQPAGLLIIAVLAVRAVAIAIPQQVLRRLLTAHALIMAIAFGLSLVALELGSNAVPGSSTATRAFGFEPLAKLAWFVTAVLPQSFNLWNLQPSLAIAWVLAVITLSGLWLHFRSQPDPVMKLVIAVSLLPAAYLPSLVVQESWPSYRSQLALMPLVLIYLVIALGAHGRWWQRNPLPVFTTAFAAIGGFSAALCVTFCFAFPLSRELKVMRDSIRELDPAPGTLVVRRARARDSLAPFVRHDEFGTPATATVWGAEALPYLIRRELQPELDNSEVRVRVAGRGAAYHMDLGVPLRALRAP